MNFYVVATPIGNLEDISLRALRILKEVDIILSEDTRVSAKLLSHYQIKKPLISFHQHSSQNKFEKVLDLLKSGKSLALISDAGTPNISDPGGQIVSYLRENLVGLNIEAIPGASALTTALSISGIRADKFCFFGFLAHKKGRQKQLKEILDSKYPVVFYESKYRVVKLLEELIDLDFKKKIMIFRELTKKHQSFYQGTPKLLLEQFKSDEKSLQGEFTIIIY
ncbi:MAG: 16S rRNA (cytidine(1402)-2'-O)-methyltransferase [Patescibacteria group bacterium]|jgi:16S rRNA (cytidine1402-2'-O)-methyltransferase|nr:16S rRNA (cytidine(1402)-2'-O)-methyltransferase [Patescibacteria group bacterium]